MASRANFHRTSDRLLPRLVSRRRRAGFTLIELMVALTGGLFFSIFVFALTRDVTRFFQREARLTDATLSALTGFERLRTDVTRSGFLVSPNLVKDPRRCPQVTEGTATDNYPLGWNGQDRLKRVAALRVTADATIADNALLKLQTPAITPDSLLLYGNYTSSEQFPVLSIDGVGSAAPEVILDPTSGALWRSGYDSTKLATDAANVAVIAAMFPVGRALRVVTPEGEEQYAIIDSTSVRGLNPRIVLTQNPSLIEKGVGNNCGLRGLSNGVMVNPVNIIEYRLRDLKTDLGSADAQVGYLFSSEAPVGESRLELVRSELSPGTDATPLAGSLEVVAEYAVDFRVGVTAVTDVAATRALKPFTQADSAFARFAGDPLGATAAAVNSGPHLVRAAHLRLSVRTLDEDRQGNAGAVTSPAFRFKLADNRFARVRTLQAVVATRNTRNMTW
ncbi:MAG TPA: prepilin-type N-terminal cleavage/methylation domain-containing protein [Polyangiaceae bacterium]|nr:prepilin-type N-terminal cleavage/methylation domain-containing protein [Polyangiaceae bacterium]